MSAGTLIVIGLLAAAFGGFIRIWTHTQPEPPAGVRLTHNVNYDRWHRWNYIFADITDITGYYWTGRGYLTRNAAIRAAQQELDRLKAKDQQTQ